MFSNDPFNTSEHNTRASNATDAYDSNFMSIDADQRRKQPKAPRQPTRFRHALHGLFHILVVFLFAILLLDVLFDILEQDILNKLILVTLIIGVWSLLTKSDQDDKVIDPATYMPSASLRIVAFIFFVIGELLLFYKTSDLIEMGSIEILILIAILGGIFNLGVLWLLADEEFIDYRLPSSDKRTVISNYVTMVILTIMLLFLPRAIPQSLPLVTILSLIYLLFYAGFFWTYAIFDRSTIQTLERITLSFMISLVLLPLTMTVLSRLGLNPIGTSIIIVNFLIATLGLIVYLFRPAYQRRLQAV